MDKLIEAKNLTKFFNTPRGPLHALEDVSFSIEKGKTLGVVGESGCGKSTLGRTLIHLHESTAGNIIFKGEDVTRLNAAQMKKFRREVSIIFQDPYSSLNPRMTAEQTVAEALKRSGKYRKNEIPGQTARILDLVGMDRRFFKAYPHELDGGRRQRIGIGRALATNPEFVVCDEPVSALDVSIQAQILNLLQDLQGQLGLTYLFITHNMAVVKYISDNICVMYLGQVVETCPTKELFSRTLHPYSKALIAAIPSIEGDNLTEQTIMKGELTSPVNPKPGCRFYSRCEYACPACQEKQNLEEILPGHFVSCCRARELNGL